MELLEKNISINFSTEELEKINRATNISQRWKGLNALFLSADVNACGSYRCIHPAEYLNRHGASCRATTVVSLRDMLAADIIIVQRQYDPNVAETLLWEAKRAGKLLIFEIDDNLDAVLPSSPVYGIYHNGAPQIKELHKIIAGCHGMTVSTVELAGDYSIYQPNCEVLPNSIDFDIRDWETLPEDKDNNFIVVGGAYGCFDNQTEIKTESGFKLFKDLLPTDKVATLNIDTKEIEYQLPTDYINAPYSGKMYLVEEDEINFCVTPNHNLLVKEGNENLKLVQAQEVFGTPLVFLGEREITISPEKQKEIDYTGTVHCVTVPNHTLYVRRKNVCHFSGNSTHMEDLQLLRTVIPEILNKYDHVKFGLYSSDQFFYHIVNLWGLDSERCLFIPPRSFKEYPKGLPYLDIGLAPVVNCRFNAAKSNLKCLEYWAHKIPAIASAVPPYARTIKDGENGYICYTPRDWIERISYLIEHEDERKRMGENGYNLVKTEYDMAKNCHLWPEAWSKIRERAKEKEVNKIWPILWGKVSRNDPCPCGSGKKSKVCHPGVWG